MFRFTIVINVYYLNLVHRKVTFLNISIFADIAHLMTHVCYFDDIAHCLVLNNNNVEVGNKTQNLNI